MHIKHLNRLLYKSFNIRSSKAYYHYSNVNLLNNTKGLIVDLRSDTLTCPSPEMRNAMTTAVVGDDVYREDTTVNDFEERVATLTNKEKALFVPTGTMGNLISVMVHCDKRGSEVLLGDKSHLFLYEQGGIAQLGGIQTHCVPTSSDGTFDMNDAVSRIRDDDIHCPTTELICIENTHNYCGGKALPLDWIKQIGEVAHAHGLPLHMDGARVMNAAMTSGDHVKDILAPCQSAVICFSKGLGTPVGSVIVGSEKFIERCRRLRKVVGGGMRQSGVLAAAGIYALDNMIQRLHIDHRNAQTIAKCIEEMNSPNVYINAHDVDTNIGMINVNPDVISSTDFCNRLSMVSTEENLGLKELGIIKMLPWSDTQVRFVTYYNITEDMIQFASTKLRFVISEIDSS